MNKIEFGDCREIMRQWKVQGIKAQMCVTSPPYYGLRDYKTGTWIGGDESCDHSTSRSRGDDFKTGDKQSTNSGSRPNTQLICQCGAIREDLQIGLEETPEEYIKAMVEVFRCVWDCLEDDGVIWVNIGDSYCGTGDKGDYKDPKHPEGRNGQSVSTTRKLVGYKQKDLIGIPWMLAFALRADGWYLRQDIIWHKPNPMPESVRDRCGKAHEYIFLLSKSKQYFFDHEAIKEPLAEASKSRMVRGVSDSHKNVNGAPGQTPHSINQPREHVTITNIPETRNKRSVWTVNTKPYKGAHFAVFPSELIDPCILAGTSKKGHCPECGNRWARKVERTRLRRDELDPSDPRYRPNRYNGEYTDINGKGDAGYSSTKTLGFEAMCECGHEPVPDVVLDPFMGSGTTAMVAIKHGRQYMGCELNPDYAELQQERIDSMSGIASFHSLFDEADDE